MEQWQGIDHCLLGVEGASVSDIKEVYSHPQAITKRFIPFFAKYFNALKSAPGVESKANTMLVLSHAITEVYDLLRKYDFFIVGEQWQGIDHCLLGVEGASVSDISRVISQVRPY